MGIFSFLTYKPVLIGLHLAFAIVGIDAFLWYLGESAANSDRRYRLKWASLIGLAGFVLSWIAGGYYYIVNYGKLVKPAILKGTAPWAHAVAMEIKEHIFLFIIPLALTAVFLAFVSKEDFNKNNLRRVAMVLAGLIVFLGLAIGAMGFIISAAARWGIK